MDFAKDFKFSPPTSGSSGPAPVPGATDLPETEETVQTPDEMGSAVIEAVKSGNAAAVYEAIKKCIEE